jgi:hypothetical protein
MILAHETSVPAGLLAQPRADLVALLRKRVTMLAASEAMNANRLGQPGTQLKVPEHPGYLMPSPGCLHREYEVALEQIAALRGQKQRRDEHREAMMEAAFDVFLRSLSASCCAIVCEAHPKGSWSRNHPLPPVPDMNVIAAAAGLGKTTLAKAFMTAVVRANAEPWPLGCVLLVHFVETAQQAFDELHALLPGRVAVWTREHDADRPSNAERAHRFSVDDLQHHPIVIVTHEFYKGVRGHKARTLSQNGMTLPRVGTFIDEKVNEIETHDVLLSDICKVCEFIQKDDHGQDPLTFAAATLLKFATTKLHGPRSLETPSYDPEGWEAAQSLQWFTTENASHYMRSRGAKHTALPFGRVFGFARCMAEGRAFIARKNEGALGCNFVGYERALPQVPGMVLLDATANIDGVSALCPWRKHTATPGARHDRLEVVHVPSVARGTLSRWLQKPQHRTEYIEQILEVTRRHVQPGQKALLVCKRELVHTQDIPHWSKHVECFANGTTKEFAWELEGRHLAVTWWGGYGIGANDWRDAHVVLLFDDFHLPGHTLIATLQGLKGHTATQGALASLAYTHDRHPDVEALRDGHILRWLKQMALRGRARELDHNGVCGEQKLVVTGDLIRLIEHFDRLFPGAKLICEEGLEGHDEPRLMKLARTLMTPNLPDRVSTKEIGALMNLEWRDVSGDLTRHPSWHKVLAGLQWRYVPVRGRPKAGEVGSHFVRITPVREDTTERGRNTDTQTCNDRPLDLFRNSRSPGQHCAFTLYRSNLGSEMPEIS